MDIDIFFQHPLIIVMADVFLSHKSNSGSNRPIVFEPHDVFTTLCNGNGNGNGNSNSNSTGNKIFSSSEQLELTNVHIILFVPYISEFLPVIYAIGYLKPRETELPILLLFQVNPMHIETQKRDFYSYSLIVMRSLRVKMMRCDLFSGFAFASVFQSRIYLVETTIEDVIQTFLWERCYSLDYIPRLDSNDADDPLATQQISIIRNRLNIAGGKLGHGISSHIEWKPRDIPIAFDTVTTTPPLYLPSTSASASAVVVTQDENPIKLLFVRKAILPRVFIPTITTGEWILDQMLSSSKKLCLLYDWERYDTDRILHRKIPPDLSHCQENIGEMNWLEQIDLLVTIRR